jgi:Peptidase M50B-like
MRPLNTTIGSAVGRTITKIDIKFNGNGATGHTGSDDSTVILFPAAFIGYLGPSAFGVGAAALIRAGHIVAVMSIALLVSGVRIIAEHGKDAADAGMGCPVTSPARGAFHRRCRSNALPRG